MRCYKYIYRTQTAHTKCKYTKFFEKQTNSKFYYISSLFQISRKVFFGQIKKKVYFCSRYMTAYNPHMTLHKLFLNIKKRDVYFN